MVICRYFLEGRCHFGHNCRNEHVYGNNSGGRGSGNAGNNDLNGILWQMSNEVVVAEKGGQWPLTSFAPIEQRPPLPGWEDISPEEVRWTLYEAQKNGTVNQAMNQITQWYKNAEKCRNLVKQRAPELVNIINEIINRNQPSHGSRNAFSSSAQDTKSSFRFDTAAANIFGKPTTPTQNSGNVFGGSSSGFQTQNVFGGVPAQSTIGDSNNIFARPQQQQQQEQQQQSNQNIFLSRVSGSQNIFSSNTGNVFGQGFSNSTASQNIFQSAPGTNMFESSQSAFGGSNTFGGSSNIFGSGQSNVFQQSGQGGDFGGSPFKVENVGFGNVNAAAKEVDSSVYSKIGDLNDNEISSFTSTTFTFGNIPLKPPPQQYC